jgi:uncharacterized DUF497 family protein
MDLEFNWDRVKAESNLRKHHISFDEATTVFYDPLSLIFDDEEHSISEKREIIIGYSKNRNLLLVFFTERNKRIRIYSARKATKMERKDYEENKHEQY